MKNLLRVCPICSNEHADVLYAQFFSFPAEYPLKNSYDVVACSKCGFVFADTEVSQKDYDHFYKEFSKYEYYDASIDGFEWDKARLENTATAISSIVKDREVKILNIGCANGDLLLKLKNKGYNMLNGLDPSNSCVKNIEKHNIKGNVGGLFNLGDIFKSERFDCIILSQVLEHVRYINILIKNINSVLKMEVYCI